MAHVPGGAGERRYDVVALQVPISYNTWSDHDHDGMLFALRRNYDELNRKDDRGNRLFRADKPHPLVRPLVLRACVGETVKVRFWNHIRDRRVGLHLVGGGYDVREHDGARVGGNPDTTVAYQDPYKKDQQYNEDQYDMDQPAGRTYEWTCEHEGVFILHDAGNLGGTEYDTNLHGLFGVLVVEPPGTVWRDSSGHEPATSAAAEVDGLYVDVYPKRRNVPKAKRARWLSKPPKYPFGDPSNPTQVAFREFVIVIHDEPEIVNHSALTKVKPPWGAGPDPHAGHAGGVSHVMPISYRAEPMANRERVLWTRITGKPISAGGPPPQPLEVPVVNEEQHHSSWLFGDPATPVLRAYLGDPVRIRLVHCGVKETHVYHLHLYAWHADPNNHAAPLIDAITISPQTAHTIEPLYGAGNRQLVPGDVIWHCHLYPHFHHGMWGLFRTYDRRRTGEDVTAQRYPDGTQMPPLQPLPDRQPPPAPAGDQDGWPRFMLETRHGADLPTQPLDRAGRFGQKSPRVPWIWDGELPAGIPNDPPPARLGQPVPYGFDYRSATDAEKEFFFQHRTAAAEPGTVLNTDPEPGWLAPYLAFADGAHKRVDRHLEVLREPFMYNRHGWQDPRGHRFRLADAQDVDGLSDAELQAGANTNFPVPPPGQQPDPVIDPQPASSPEQREPAFFRVHHGDPVALTLHNRIAYPIPGDAFDFALPRPSVPGLWECGLHVHMVKFDVMCADGASSGWNYMSGPRPGYRLDYKWWADEEFGVIFTHDHLFANYRQKRGLFGAMLVEPENTRWLDPWHPTTEIIAGEQAVIVDTETGRAFRELVLGGLDFVPLHGGDGVELNAPEAPTSDGDQGSMGVNYRSAPLRERRGDPSTWFASMPHDPDTPLLHSYPGEPIWLRLLQGAHEELHSFSLNGMRWRRFRDDPRSPQQSQQTIGLSEAFTFTINDDGELPYEAGDYLWRTAGIDDTWLGCWGILRAHPAPSSLPTLEEAAGAHDIDYRPPPDLPAPRDRPVRKFKVRATHRTLMYRDDLVDRFGLVYQATEMTTPDGKTIPLHEDPDAPLVLRCRQGESVEVTLKNELRPGIKPEPFAPAVPIDLPEGQREVSTNVSLHADLVRVHVATDDGSRVGFNPDSTVAAGSSRTYHWTADVELGPVPLYDLADVRNHRHHGLVGALIVEPADAVPVRVEHRDAGRSAPPKRQAWTGVQAVIHSGQEDDAGARGGREEIVLVLQDGLRFFIDDNLAVPFPDIPADPGEAGVDPEDQGQKAINYRSDPTGPQRWLGSPSRAAEYQFPPDRPLWVHLVGGFDKPRNHSLNVHGFTWPEWPHQAGLSPRLGGEGGLTVNSARTLQLRTGSRGDHAVRSGVVRYSVGQGLWALLSIQQRTGASPGGVTGEPGRADRQE